jgi:hypothetical protein
MDYDDVASKERVTGRAYFNPGFAGSAGIISMPWLDLGNIQMMSLDYGIKRKEHFKARRGTLIADRFDAYSATPRWTITGDEYVSATMFLIFLGTDKINLTQGAVVNGTLAFTAHLGGVLDVGKFALYNWSTSPGGVDGVDYVMDPGPGKLYVPMDSSWLENAAKSLTYSCPAITWDRVIPPMSNLTRTGNMQIIEEDDSLPVGSSTTAAPKTVHDFPVSLSTDAGGDSKVDDYKTFKMIATIIDPSKWVIRKRFASNYAYG